MLFRSVATLWASSERYYYGRTVKKIYAPESVNSPFHASWNSDDLSHARVFGCESSVQDIRFVITNDYRSDTSAYVSIMGGVAALGAEIHLDAVVEDWTLDTWEEEPSGSSGTAMDVTKKTDEEDVVMDGEADVVIVADQGAEGNVSGKPSGAHVGGHDQGGVEDDGRQKEAHLNFLVGKIGRAHV